MINKNSKIYISGHSGMVGSACLRIFKSYGYKNIIYKNSKELDLRNQKKVSEFISLNKPEIIINAAARVGGIIANNKYPYEFLLHNLQIQNNLIMSAHQNDVKKFIFLGSSCIYPKMSNQPIKPDYLLTSSLEPTNQWYAIAKISGLKLIEALNKQYGRDYISLMPTNLYGPNDNFDMETSHVLPALISKFFHQSKESSKNIQLWGSGNPLREFLHVDDLAEAVYFCLTNKVHKNIINVGSGEEISIRDLAIKIKNITGFSGKIIWNNKMDGTPRKLLDSSILKLDSLSSLFIKK